MLVPNRFSNLKFSLINVTALVIDLLLQENKATVKDILTHLRNYSKEFSRDDVLHALTFLYAVGRIKYSEKQDQVTLMNTSNIRESVSA